MTKTYTGRTQLWMLVYALIRKLLIYIVGHRGVEPRTSRLSGSLFEKGGVYIQSENALASTSRFFRRANRTAGISPPGRTQNVHKQNFEARFDGLKSGAIGPPPAVYAERLSSALNSFMRRALQAEQRAWV